ncbi:Sec-independent protein translocase subunit TatA [Nocardia sp. CDC153]|uniref:Sec-independent protein translocase subunit TatA n=1 Tax=Nocardia sp. CDC153 TaxID=3112167 RepID=UPI002DBFE9D1|nr:Sec-independent protein translocase subunit TatA [Nocardia sp. CDC153]MEC3956158.1 Sec-independent protein translocase subunit TatA [Nocardia sp. CDC153]
MTGAISPWHLLIVVLIFLLFFGSKRMPDAARSLGRSMRIFKTEVSQMQAEGKTGEAAPEAQAQPAQPVTPPAQLPPAQPVQPPAPQPNDQQKA